MQLGMIAANRVFAIIDTQDQIQDTGTIEAPIFLGNLKFKDVHFSYIPDEVIKGIDLQMLGNRGHCGFYRCRKIDDYNTKPILRNRQR
jgi:ABC-type multidrug transport system fused ATPase/permease subunit